MTDTLVLHVLTLYSNYNFAFLRPIFLKTSATQWFYFLRPTYLPQYLQLQYALHQLCFLAAEQQVRFSDLGKIYRWFLILVSKECVLVTAVTVYLSSGVFFPCTLCLLFQPTLSPTNLQAYNLIFSEFTCLL